MKRVYNASLLLIKAITEFTQFILVGLRQFNLRLKSTYYTLIYDLKAVRGSDVYANFANVGSQLAGIVGPAIASANVIAPSYGIHHVTGTNVIKTITPPYPGFQGDLALIPDSGIWTWDTTGNIGLAGTVTAANGLVVYFTFDGLKWWPSRVS